MESNRLQPADMVNYLLLILYGKLSCFLLLQISHWHKVGSLTESTSMALRHSIQTHYLLWGLCVVQGSK